VSSSGLVASAAVSFFAESSPSSDWASKACGISVTVQQAIKEIRSSFDIWSTSKSIIWQEFRQFRVRALPVNQQNTDSGELHSMTNNGFRILRQHCTLPAQA
jgi:hypothetical protein